MSPPSIRLPLLPPNVFLATLLTLTMSNPTTALPGIGGSGYSLAPKRTTGGNSNSNSQPTSTNMQSLSPGQIAGLVCGLLLGLAVLALVITALLKKDSKGGSLNKLEPTAVVRVIPTAAALAAAAKKTNNNKNDDRSRQQDWDAATEVGDDHDAASTAARDEKTQVLVASDAASEVTQLSRR